MNYELVQIITGTVGAFAFGILFNLKGKRLAAAAAGGLLCCVGFIVLSQFIESEPINYFLVSMIVSVYAEAMARIIKTPATPLITTSLKDNTILIIKKMLIKIKTRWREKR